MPALTIPVWFPPLVSTDAADIQRTEYNVIAEGQPIPIIYGESQVRGKVFALHHDTATDLWTAGVAWCLGEIDSIQAVYLNGEAAVGGVTRTDYLGTTSQAADATLISNIPGPPTYADTLVLSVPGSTIGVAYSVFTWTGTHYSSFPQFHATIRGMENNGGVWSDNPAHALKDLIENSVYGLGGTTDATTFANVATACSTNVTTEARRLIGLTIENPQPTMKWIEVLSGYASCWTFKRGDTWYAIEDRPRASDATIGKADYVKDSFQIELRDRGRVPSVVRVEYTDTSENIWRRKHVDAELTGVSSGATPRRLSSVRMPGITRYSQASREAQERLDKLQNAADISFIGNDEQLVRELGDVITVTHDYGPSADTFRINVPPEIVKPGRVRVRGTLYQATDYDDSEDADPSFGLNNQFLGLNTISTTSIGEVSGAVFHYDDFNDNDLTRFQATWDEIIASSGELSVRSGLTGAPSPVGSFGWTHGNNAGNDHSAYAVDRSLAVPIESGELYRVIFIWRQHTGGGLNASTFMGVAGWKGDYRNGNGAAVNVTGADSMSAQHYHAVRDYEAPDANWVTSIGYFQLGTGNGTNATIDVPSGADSGGGAELNAPGDMHQDTEAVTPIFYVNNTSEAGIVDIGYVAIEKVENHGATAGVNIFADDGTTVLADIDLRNDHAVTTHLSALNPNPSMQEQRVNSNGDVAPGSWLRWNSATAHLTYADADRDILLVPNTTANVVVSNAAVPVSPDKEYEVIVMVRDVDGASSVADVAMYEYDGDLASGEIAIGNTGVTDAEPGVRNGSRGSQDIGLANMSLTTSFQVFTSDPFTVTSTAKWMSLAIGGANRNLEFEWIVLRERHIADKSASNVAFAADAGTVANETTSWVSMLSASIDIGPVIGDTDVVVLFLADVYMTEQEGHVANDSDYRVTRNDGTQVDIKRIRQRTYMTSGEPLVSTYDKSADQTGNTTSPLDINGFALLASPDASAATQDVDITLISGTEFEIDTAGTYLIMADISVEKNEGGGHGFGTIHMQDRTSGGVYGTTPGTIKKWQLIESGSNVTGDTVSIHAILTVVANHRFKFQLTNQESTANDPTIAGGGSRVTVTKLDGIGIPNGVFSEWQGEVNFLALDSAPSATGSNTYTVEHRQQSGIPDNYDVADRQLLLIARKK